MGTFDPGLFFWTAVTFGVLLFLLARFAFKPLRRLLEAREHAIRSSLEEARNAREEARRVQEENRRATAEVREEAGRIIREGHRVVESMRKEAAERGREEAENLVRQAREEIDAEVRRSLDDLKSTVSDLSVRISRQIVREQIDEERHHHLAEEFIERMKKTHAGKRG